ncbi:MAG: hypothetical protein ACYC5H_14285 [Methylovirgula sp.]
MASFLEASRAKCPHCGKEDLTGPSEPQANDILTCIGCNRSFALEDAVAAGIKEALVKEFAKDGSFKRESGMRKSVSGFPLASALTI